MHLHHWRTSDWARAIGVGIATAIVPSLFMVPMFKLGLSPMPGPPSLEFAKIVLGQQNLPMPVGLGFHVAYVLFWSLVFTGAFPRRSLATAVALAGVLWLGVLLVFFPLFGWGIAGTGVSVKLIPASLIPHALFGVALWFFTRLAFDTARKPATAH